MLSNVSTVHFVEYRPAAETVCGLQIDDPERGDTPLSHTTNWELVTCPYCAKHRPEPDQHRQVSSKRVHEQIKVTPGHAALRLTPGDLGDLQALAHHGDTSALYQEEPELWVDRDKLTELRELQRKATDQLMLLATLPEAPVHFKDDTGRFHEREHTLCGKFLPGPRVAEPGEEVTCLRCTITQFMLIQLDGIEATLSSILDDMDQLKRG